MKICWDEIEKIIYRIDLECWQNINQKTIFYTEEVCDSCGELFLKQKRTKSSNGNFCNRKCYNVYRKLNPEKYTYKNKIKKECVICGEKDDDNFYRSDKSYCKECRRNLTRKNRQETDKVYKYKKTKEYNKKRYKKRRLYYCMSARVRQSLKNGKGGEKWTDLVGYSVKELKIHLEKQFNDEMNWNNYGSVWEIDHIKPIATFNINSYEDNNFKECWSLKNLRPLSLYENRSRGAILGNNRRKNNG